MGRRSGTVVVAVLGALSVVVAGCSAGDPSADRDAGPQPAERGRAVAESALQPGESPTRKPAQRPAAATRPASAVTARRTLDPDGDRIASSLERVLAARPAARDVDVVVQTAGAPAAARLARAASALPGVTARVVPATSLVAVTAPAARVPALAGLPGVVLVEVDHPISAGPVIPAGATGAAATTLTPTGRVVRAGAASTAASAVDPAHRAGVTLVPGAPPVVASASGWTPSPVDSDDAPAQYLSQLAPDLPVARSSFGVDGDADGDRAAYSSGDVVVAVIDTGIDDTHPWLDGGKVLLHQDFVSQRALRCGAAPAETGRWDEYGHGTHVAGIIAGEAGGTADGVAPGAALLDLKVFDCTGSGSMSDVDAALAWLLTHHTEYGVRVANLSLGAADFTADGTDATSRLVDRLVAAGVQVVVAAGNSGAAPRTLGVPAAAPLALTVGAAGAGRAGEWPAPFGSRGPTADGRPGLDVTAPGVNVLSAQNRTLSAIAMSGTSMASPFVAGLAALGADLRPDLAPSATACDEADTTPECADGVADTGISDPVADALRGSATDWFTPGVDAQSGAGMVRPFAALAAIAVAPGASAAAPESVPSLPEGSSPPQASSFSVSLTPSKRVVVPVRAGAAPAAVTVIAGSTLSSDRLRLRWLDAAGAELPTQGLMWSSGAMTIADEFSFETHQVGAALPAGTAPRWLEVRLLAGSLDANILVTGASPVAALSDGLHLEPVTASAEGGTAGRVDVVLDRDLASPVTFRVRGDGQLVPAAATVTVGPALARSRVPVAVRAAVDVVPEGRHTGLLVLTPEAGAPAWAPVLRASVPIADDDEGAPARLRVLVDGAESSEPVVDDTQVISVGDDGALAFTSRALALRARVGNPYGVAAVVPAGSQEPVVPALGATGGQVTSATTEALGIAGSRLLAGLWPGGQGAVPGDDDSAYELFVHDLGTGVNTRVGLTPAQRAGMSWPATVTPSYTATLSADGSTVAFVSAGSEAEYQAGTAGLWVSRVGDAAPLRVADLSGSVSIMQVAADVVRYRLGTDVLAVRLSTGAEGEPVAAAPVVESLSDVGGPLAVQSAAVDAEGTTLVVQTADGWWSRDLQAGVTVALPRPELSSGAGARLQSVAADGRPELVWQTVDELTRAYWDPQAQTFTRTANWRVALFSTGQGITRGWFSLTSPSGRASAVRVTDPAISGGDTNLGVDLLAGALPATAAGGLPAVSGLRSQRVAGGVRLAWDAVPGATRYRVGLVMSGWTYRSIVTSATAVTFDASLISGTTATVTPLAAAGADGPASRVAWHAPSIAGLRVAATASGVGVEWEGAARLLVVARPAGSTDAPTAFRFVDDEGGSFGPASLDLAPGDWQVLVVAYSGFGYSYTTDAAWPLVTVTGQAPTGEPEPSEPGDPDPAGEAADAIELGLPDTLVVGTPAALTASATSGAPVVVAVSGACHVAAEALVADAASGVCTVSAQTPGGGGYAPASLVRDVALGRRADAVRFTGVVRVLAYGGRVAIGTGTTSGLPVRLSVAGSCALSAATSPATLTARAGVGTCTVTASSDGDATRAPASASASVTLALAGQTWRTSMAAPTSVTRPLQPRLGRAVKLSAATVTTSAGLRGAWSVSGTSCRLSVGAAGAVSVVGRARGRCTVSVSSSLSGRVARISRVWSVRVV